MNDKRKNFDKRFKLHVAVTFTTDKPEKNFIRFASGYAYAGDGYVFVRAALRHISNFDPQELEIMEGRSISAAAFQRLLEYDTVSVTTRGFEAADIFGNRIVFGFNEQLEINAPTATMFERLTDHYREERDTMGVSLAWMNRAAKIIGASRLRMELYKTDMMKLTDPNLDNEKDISVFVAVPYVNQRNEKGKRK